MWVLKQANRQIGGHCRESPTLRIEEVTSEHDWLGTIVFVLHFGRTCVAPLVQAWQHDQFQQRARNSCMWNLRAHGALIAARTLSRHTKHCSQLIHSQKPEFSEGNPTSTPLNNRPDRFGIGERSPGRPGSLVLSSCRKRHLQARTD